MQVQDETIDGTTRMLGWAILMIYGAMAFVSVAAFLARSAS